MRTTRVYGLRVGPEFFQKPTQTWIQGFWNILLWRKSLGGHTAGYYDLDPERQLQQAYPNSKASNRYYNPTPVKPELYEP